jgi:outer membrane receptor protein involved in Fe transport
LGGNGLEQFMLGAVADSSTGITSQPYSSYPYWGLYLQDEYRILPNLTFNIGLRDDMIFFWKSRDHPESNFCLDCMNSATGLPGEMVYEGQSSLIPKDAAIAPPHLADLAPRFGFAWNPSKDKKTVIRGSYSLMYTNAINAINNIGQGGLPTQ